MGMEDRNMELKKVLQNIIKKSKINFTLWSYVALGIGIFFLLGSFVGVDESTKDVLPIMYTIVLIAAVVFAVFKVLAILENKWAKKEESFKEETTTKEESLKVEPVIEESSKKEEVVSEIEIGSDNDKEQLDDLCRVKQNFEDETVKKYYEIIFGMYKAIDGNWLKLSKREEIIKRYIEIQINGEVENEKLQIALELSKIARDTTDKSAIAEFLRDYHKELKDKNTYIEKNFDVIDLFYKNEFEIMQEEFNGILEVIKDIQTFKSFTQGIQKRIIKNGEKIDFKTVTMIRRIIRQSFCGGNLIMQKVLVDYLYSTIYERSMSRSAYDALVVVALKALHFEKYGNDSVSYITINDNDCRNYVLSDVLTDDSYRKEIEENPFEKEEKIEEIVKKQVEKLKEVDIIGPGYYVYEKHVYIQLIDKDDYFVDCLCNAAWKECKNTRWIDETGRDTTDSKELIDVRKIICSYYIKNYAKNEN